MSFSDLLQLNAYSMATGPGSESITYKASPGFASQSLTAVVIRYPRTEMRELLVNTVEVWIDKLQLASPVIDADLVVVDSTEHTVVSAQDYRGGWLLRAVR